MNSIIQTVIPLGPITSINASRLGYELRPNVKRWKEAQAAIQSGLIEIRTLNKGQYSCRCPYFKYDYNILIKSFIVYSGDSAKIHAFKFKFDLKLPKGFVFDQDSEGIKICRVSRPSADYHFNLDELLEEKPEKFLVRKLVELEKIRAKQKKEEALRRQFRSSLKRNIHNTFVLMEDSRRAGNCVQGTLSFCEGSGLARNVVPAQKLERIKKLRPDISERIDRAIRCAFERETTISI